MFVNNTMVKRPSSVTLIGWLFIAAGVTGILYHSTEFNIHDPFAGELLLGLFVRLLAIIGGIFMLRGADWSRWLLIAWMAYHVVLSFYHDLAQVAMHAVLLAVIAYFIFRTDAAAYFKRANTK